MKFIGSIPKTMFAVTSGVLLTGGLLLAGTAPASAASANQAAANALNRTLESDMAGNMTIDHVANAREVIETAKERDLDQQAATIAIATVIVETHLDNLPGGDRDSVGLFQQRDHYGSQEDRLDPGWAADAFYDELEFVYPDEGWADDPIGDVAQGVQRSAYPDRYQYQAEDAEVIVDRLW